MALRVTIPYVKATQQRLEHNSILILRQTYDFMIQVAYPILHVIFLISSQSNFAMPKEPLIIVSTKSMTYLKKHVSIHMDWEVEPEHIIFNEVFVQLLTLILLRNKRHIEIGNIYRLL